MCLAIYKPAGASVKEEYLRNGFANHSDGAGFAWSENEKIQCVKGIFDADEMIKQYEKIKDFHCLIHFRKATHGKVDATNCHPFLFNDGKLALIHNGVLNIECTMEGLSDTAHFVKLVLEPFIKKYNIPINDIRLKYLIETSIGTDKMAVMTENGDTFLFNGKKGEWADGAWYSNTSYKWAYSRSSYKSNDTTPVTGPVYGASLPIGKSYNHKNWRKKFDSDSEGDESYLEFWKQALDESKSDSEGNPSTETQKLPKLIGNGTGTTITVEEVENMSDEQIKSLTTTTTTTSKQDGQMMEYGWYDEEIENDIKCYMEDMGMSREMAIIRAFNPHNQ